MPALALLPLASVIAALMALLILYGGRYLGKLVGQLVPNWGIPGLGNIRSAVNGAIDVAIAVLEALLDDALKPLAHVITYPITMMARLYDRITATIVSLYDISAHIIRTAIPRALLQAKTYALDQVNALHHLLGEAIGKVRDYATALYNKAVAFTQAEIAALHHLLGEALGAAVNALRAEISAARTYAAGLVAALHSYVDTLVAKAVATLSASITAVDTFARAAYRDTLGRIADAVRQLEADIVTAATAAEQAAITTVETAVVVGIGDVWGDVITGVEGAIKDAADGFDWVKDELAKIDLSKVTDLAGLAALTGINTAVLSRYLRECGMPNCRNLSHLGRDLQALLGLVEGAAFATLIAEMVSDPHGAAHDIIDTLGGLANDTIGSARQLFGVS